MLEKLDLDTIWNGRRKNKWMRKLLTEYTAQLCVDESTYVFISTNGNFEVYVTLKDTWAWQIPRELNKYARELYFQLKANEVSNANKA